MLQQTQVARVMPKYLAFLADFPDPAACAGRPAGDVVAAWVGLGYNRRALNLHRCAVAVTEQGGFPRDLAGLMTLPGVGPYTARAILAFAFEADVAVVDTNIARLLARLSGRTLTSAEVQRMADSSVPVGEGWAWNQVVMELGALVCTARRPACDGCPLVRSCAWRGVGLDPAVGSAGVSRGQSPFVGSDRQGRGRLVRALSAGAVANERLASTMGWPDDPERARRVAETVVSDGLAVREGGSLRLP